MLATVVALLFMFLIAPFQTSATTSTDVSPIGLWFYRENFPTGQGGVLIISRTGAYWRGSIGKQTASQTTTSNAVLLSFSDGGAFRGVVRNGTLHGFWVRRPMLEDPLYPFGEALAYATSLALTQTAVGRWTANVQPLPDTFTLYLKIFRDTDGVLKAAFRNPEQNSHGSAMQFIVVQTGALLRFTRPADPTPQDPSEATVLRDPTRIALVWKDLKRMVELEPASPQEAAAFFPRGPSPEPYVYREPEAGNDGWGVARAGDLGMDEAALGRAVQRIIDKDPAGDRPWLIHSITVAYRGKLVLDEYFYGHDKTEQHDTRSASKTFSSLILGALIKEGSQLSPQSKVYDVLASRGPFLNPDPRKARITLGDLLTHTAGFACDDNADASPGNEDMIESDRSNPDWAKVTLDLPMQFEPGEHYAYCSMNINLAGAMLSQSTGEWLPELFDRTVARPLDFGPYSWNLMGNGEGYLGGGVFVRPRDFLKLGQAYLDGGVWNGRRIVSADWVKDSLSPHAHISPATTGLTGDAFNQVYYDVDEGWAWHMIDVKSGNKEYPAFHANGNGGQLLLIVPTFDLVVMFTAGNYGQGLWNRERDDIVGGMIIPAIKQNTWELPAQLTRNLSGGGSARQPTSLRCESFIARNGVLDENTACRGCLHAYPNCKRRNGVI